MSGTCISIDAALDVSLIKCVSGHRKVVQRFSCFYMMLHLTELSIAKGKALTANKLQILLMD